MGDYADLERDLEDDREFEASLARSNGRGVLSEEYDFDEVRLDKDIARSLEKERETRRKSLRQAMLRLLDADVGELDSTSTPDLYRLTEVLMSATVIRDDWHEPTPGEPPCSVGQWRTRDRRKVIDMSAMSDHHLGCCIRFARTKHVHRRKLRELYLEELRRGLGFPIETPSGDDQ